MMNKKNSESFVVLSVWKIDLKQVVVDAVRVFHVKSFTDKRPNGGSDEELDEEELQQ